MGGGCPVPHDTCSLSCGLDKTSDQYLEGIL